MDIEKGKNMKSINRKTIKWIIFNGDLNRGLMHAIYLMEGKVVRYL